MNTIFIGGSRHVSRLAPAVKGRIDNILESNQRIIIGDANGADKAVQKYLLSKRYEKVTVFCSGELPRNNLGNWHTHHVNAPQNAKGFHFYAAKDREMAREADFGLMIWDGKSPGTVLNVMRLAVAGKIAVLFNVPEKRMINIRTLNNWKSFFSQFSQELQCDLKERATPEERRFIRTTGDTTLFSLLDGPHSTFQSDYSDSERLEKPEGSSLIVSETLAQLNSALASGDPVTIVSVLGILARERGMSKIARETGLARESLYRSLDANGNPEFATVLKVIASVGLRLEAKSDSSM